MKSERLDEAKDAVNKLHALEMELAQTKAAREKETDCLAALEQSKTKVRKDLVPRPRFPTPFVLGPMSPPLPPRGVASRCFVPHAASHFSVLASSAIASLFVHFSELTTSTCPILALLFPTTHTHTHTQQPTRLLALQTEDELMKSQERLVAHKASATAAAARATLLLDKLEDQKARAATIKTKVTDIERLLAERKNRGNPANTNSENLKAAIEEGDELDAETENAKAELKAVDVEHKATVQRTTELNDEAKEDGTKADAIKVMVQNVVRFLRTA